MARWSSGLFARGVCLSTPEHLEVARLFLAKARADLAAANLLASAEDQDDGVVGFHAHQAVEKALKGVLAAHQVEIPRTHDLAFLLDLVGGLQFQVSESLEGAEWLNPWAVTMRYDESSAPLDRRAAVETAAASVAWALEILDVGA